MPTNAAQANQGGGGSDGGAQATVHTDGIRMLAKTLSDSLIGTGGGPGWLLFVGFPGIVEEPWPNGLNMGRYAAGGSSGDNAAAHVGLMPGWSRPSGYFQAGEDVKTAFDTQMSTLLNLLKKGTGSGQASVFDLVTYLADGLNKTADAYDQGEKVAATDLNSLEQQLGVNPPTPSFP